MWKPAKETTRKLDDKANYFYGFGWQVGQLNGHKLVSHGGTLTGFRAFFLWFLDDKLSVIVLTNEASADPETIARGIAAHYLLDLAPAAR